MPAPHPDNPMPFGVYFIVAFVLGVMVTGLLVSFLRDASMAWPVGARLALAASPLVFGSAYGARAFAFGRADRLTLRQALRQALPFMRGAGRTGAERPGNG